MSREPQPLSLCRGRLGAFYGSPKGRTLRFDLAHVDLDKGRITLEDIKNGDRRVIPLTGHALDLLRQQRQGEMPDLVFPGREGKGPVDLERGWRHAVRRAGLQDFRFHDLRHSCASYLAMGGASLVESGAILGHRSLEVTRRYAHLSEGHTRKVLTRMNRGLFG